MIESLKMQIQEAFAECYCLDDVARLYFEIRCEIENQLNYMNLKIAKEMSDNGVFDEKGGGEDA